METCYCDKCDKRVESHREKRNIYFPVRGEDITVNVAVMICNECGEECYNEELETELFIKGYNIYRERRGIIFPSEIETLMGKYGLTQRSLAALLGWGEVTVHRYVGGSLPDEAHNQLLQLLSNTENFRKIFEQNKHRLNERPRKSIEGRLKLLLDKSEPPALAPDTPQDKYEPGINTGFKRFSIEILEAMILYFVLVQGGVVKTKLMKLLFYADFLHYQRHSVSISGTTYAHLPHGPAPDDYSYYLADMKLNGLIDIEETLIGDYPGEKVLACAKPDLDIFPESALEVMREVKKYFAKLSAGEISEISHNEPAYKKSKTGKPISYEFANNMNVKFGS